MNAQLANSGEETMAMMALAESEGGSQASPSFYRSEEHEQENWADWWLDFDRSGE
jgi:hypothetical protein